MGLRYDASLKRKYQGRVQNCNLYGRKCFHNFFTSEKLFPQPITGNKDLSEGSYLNTKHQWNHVELVNY